MQAEYARTRIRYAEVKTYRNVVGYYSIGYFAGRGLATDPIASDGRLEWNAFIGVGRGLRSGLRITVRSGPGVRSPCRFRSRRPPANR